MTDTTSLGPEDLKIVTLARSARARNGVPEGAAVRDETGRTYVAATVELPMEEDLAAVRDLGGAGTPVVVAGPDGTVRRTLAVG